MNRPLDIAIQTLVGPGAIYGLGSTRWMLPSWPVYGRPVWAVWSFQYQHGRILLGLSCFLSAIAWWALHNDQLLVIPLHKICTSGGNQVGSGHLYPCGLDWREEQQAWYTPFQHLLQSSSACTDHRHGPSVAGCESLLAKSSKKLSKTVNTAWICCFEMKIFLTMQVLLDADNYIVSVALVIEIGSVQ